MAKQKIQLSDHFNYSRLLRFVLPCIGTMLFTSIYGVVDGLCVSNFVGKTAFAAVNLIMPLPMLIGTVGFMLGTGGSAIVGITLGEGDEDKANRYFSLFVLTAFLAGVALSVLGLLILRPVAILMGAKGEMLDFAVRYGRVLMVSVPTFILQNMFQSFFVTASKPKLGLYVILSAGLTNIVLDFLLVGVWHFGLAGAALATICGECIGGLFPVVYFLRPNSSLLRLGKTHLKLSVLGKTCLNGSSELMTNLSSSIVNSLFNVQLLRLAGENGVAAYGAIMYVSFIFAAIFIGYSMGSAPLVSYHYGADNHIELKNLFKKSLTLIGIWALILFTLARLSATPLTTLFVGYDQTLLNLTRQGFILYGFVYLVNGFNIYGSSFFTALNNGPVSALISFLRTLVFQTLCVMVLPIFFGLTGVWLSVTIAEILTLCVTVFFFLTMRKKYHY